ncbi:MAG: rod shape-determining protein RodA [Candidatus Andersenbacteria bacterium]
MSIREIIRALDWTLLSAVLLLILVGFAMLISATDRGSLLSSLFTKQLIAAGVGLTLGLVAIKTPYHVWRQYSWVVYGAGIAGLLLVTVLGAVVRGAISRLEIFGFQIQPSEYMKVALVMVLAWLFSQVKNIRLKLILISGLVVGIPVILVAQEPDFGVASLMVAMWVGLLIFSGLSWRIIAVLGIVGILASGGLWQWTLLDYQKERVLTFLDPSQDPLRSGYNVTQSIIALGSGQVLGRGLGQGPQSQLKFLPERHTDFVLASIGEELGFIGIAGVVILYGVMLWRLLLIARRTQDPFGQLIVVAVFLLLLASFVVSAGMNMALLPVTGIPLPLISYGGSNLVVTLFLIGLVESVHVYSTFMRRPTPEISHFV